MQTLPYRKVCVIDLVFGGIVTLVCILLASNPMMAVGFAGLGFGAALWRLASVTVSGKCLASLSHPMEP